MKRRIKLIVTGDVERSALVPSLRRWFPERVNNIDVEWLSPHKVHGTTTARLRPPETGISSSMLKLARTMLAEVCSGSDPHGQPPDLVLAIDDLELANETQPAVVIAQLKAAIEAEILRRKPSDGDAHVVRQKLRERCSFHLLAPMIEAYFFADPAALFRAGVPRTAKPRLLRADVEDFETNDPAWLPTCMLENAARLAEGKPWWRHERHPKHYLVHLSPPNVPYAETTHGAAALESLDWPRIPADEVAARFIRALFADLSEWFEIDCPLDPGRCARETSPVDLNDRRALLLRNL